MHHYEYDEYGVKYGDEYDGHGIEYVKFYDAFRLKFSGEYDEECEYARIGEYDDA